MSELTALRQIPDDVLSDKLIGGNTAINQLIKTIGDEKTAMSTIQTIHKSFFSLIDTPIRPFLPTPWVFIQENSEQRASFGTTVSFQITGDATYMSEAFLRLRIGSVKPSGDDCTIRYVAFPAHRLVQRVLVKHQRSFLERHDSNIFNAHYDLFVHEDRKSIWRQFVGQDGDLQCFKPAHDAVELILPLQFFFCASHRGLFISRTRSRNIKIEVELASSSEIFSISGSNPNFVEPTIEAQLWYKGHYMNPVIDNILSGKSRYEKLVRVWQSQTSIAQLVPDGEIRIPFKDITYPIETLYIAVRPFINSKFSQHWNSYSFLDPFYKHELTVAVTETRSQFTIQSINGTQVVLKRIDGYDPDLAIRPSEVYNPTWELVLTYKLTSGGEYVVSYAISNSSYSSSTDEFTLTLADAIPETRNQILSQKLQHFSVVDNVSKKIRTTPSITDFMGVTYTGSPVFYPAPPKLLRDNLRLNGGTDWIVVPFGELTSLNQPSGYIDIRGKAKEFSINLKVDMAQLEKMRIATGDSSPVNTSLEAIVLAQTLNVLYMDDDDGLLKLRFI